MDLDKTFYFYKIFNSCKWQTSDWMFSHCLMRPINTAQNIFLKLLFLWRFMKINMCNGSTKFMINWKYLYVYILPNMDKMFLEGCFLQHVYVGVMVISLFTYIYPGLFLARRGVGVGGHQDERKAYPSFDNTAKVWCKKMN